MRLTEIKHNLGNIEGSIEALPTESTSQSQRFSSELFFKSISPEISSNKVLENSQLIVEASEELRNNPNLARDYQEILLNNNTEYLKKKSEEKLSSLKDLFFEGAHVYNYFAFRKRKAKLDEFADFVDQIKPIRGDKADLAFSEFSSPRKTKKVSSFGDQDVIAQADDYVYGSFDKIRHHMSDRSAQQYELSGEDGNERGQVVMQDIANIRSRSTNQNLVQNYLNNVFDYKTGKEILAVYLASVFESPNEAINFIARNNTPMEAQRWDSEGILSYPIDLLPDQKLSMSELNRLANARSQKIVEKMKELNLKLGIEPPLSLEVRIRDAAKIIK